MINTAKHFFLLLFSVFSIILNAQNSVLIVQTQIEGTYGNKDRKIHIQVFDTTINSFKTIHQITQYDIHIPSNGLLISPNNKYIAIINSRKLSKEEWEKTRKLYINSLILIDKKGNIVNKIDKDIQRIAWHPDGEKIAYITGTYKEDGFNFSPIGVYYLNIETGVEIKIPTIKYPYKINWLKKDDADLLYIKEMAKDDNPVYEFNANSQQIKLTQYKDLHFSPDGKYYIQYPEAEVGEWRFSVFETATNKEITDNLSVQVNPERWVHLYWVFDKGHFYIYTDNPYSEQSYIYDMETKEKVTDCQGVVHNITESPIKTPEDVMLLKTKDEYSVLKLENNKIKKISTLKMDAPKH